MTTDNNQRKLEHIDIAISNKEVDRNGDYFDKIKLSHRALPEIDYAKVDPSVTFLDQQLSFPLLISAITGGNDPKFLEINKNLALAAEACSVAMSVGSQRILFDNEAAKSSFRLREFAPTALMFANLGAVQLNYGFGYKECQQAVDLLTANALVLHLNPLQEVIQRGGNTDFSNLIEKIANIRDKLTVPIILKEVGAGFSTVDATLALSYGFNIIDIAGKGGTSWSLIEHQRNINDFPINELGKTFQDWGIATPDALIKLRQQSEHLSLIASGGIRNGIDMVKASVLGANMSGIALPFLKPALMSAEKVIDKIEKIKIEYITAMFLLGCDRHTKLINNKSLIVT